MISQLHSDGPVRALLGRESGPRALPNVVPFAAQPQPWLALLLR
jgi:hypothetical protein